MDYTNIISAGDLEKIFTRADVKIFDATYALAGPSPQETFAQKHIPGTQYFDIDAVADPDAPLAHTLPAPDVFEAAAQVFGINAGDQIVIYEQSGIAMAATRAWWMFRAFGHDKVAVLDGGLPKWAGPVETGPATARPRGNFKAAFRPSLFRKADDVLANIKSCAALTVDARDPTRFEGTAPEPRPGMQPGHIPGSANLFFMNLLNPDKTLKSPDALRAELVKAGVPEKGKAIISSCGSGVTACVLALALHRLGNPDVAVYGGSWAEWGQNPALPKETGHGKREIGTNASCSIRG